MDLDLLSLPPEILAKIFSNIPWSQLINVKLTARKLKYVTEKYHKNMQKPSLFTIFLGNDFTHNDGIDRIHITYSILKADMDPLGDVSEEKEFFMPSSQLDQLHSFLQKFNDITFLDKMGIFLDNHTDVIPIFNGYLHSDFEARNVYVFTWNCEKDLGYTLSLLQKLQRVENLELDLEFQHLDAPKDFIIPIRNSLKSIFIHEVENTTFVNSRMIKYIVENNPDLCKFNLYFSSLETYKMVVETIVKEELSRSNKDCSHKHISLGLGISRDDEPSELLNYLNSGEFPYNFTHGEYDLYEGNLECPACGGIDSIEILGKRFV